MEIVNASRNNLASVLMGKNIQFPWRGQNNVVICVPYEEWLAFIQKYKALLKYRKPLNYEYMLQADENVKIRYFIYDMSWSLYSELACSSNVGKDATLILPHFDGGRRVSIQELVTEYYKLGEDNVTSYHNSLKAVSRTYFGLSNDDVDLLYGLVDVPKLSEWNTLIYKICIYLQSRSSNKFVTEKINIDWRVS